MPKINLKDAFLTWLSRVYIQSDPTQKC